MMIIIIMYATITLSRYLHESITSQRLGTTRSTFIIQYYNLLLTHLTIFGTVLFLVLRQA